MIAEGNIFTGSLNFVTLFIQASGSNFARGHFLCAPRPAAARCAAKRSVTHAVAAETERFRLNNLSPQKGSRRQEKRKGRGYGAGQVRIMG